MQLGTRLDDLNPSPPVEELPVAAARERLEHDARVFAGARFQVAEVRDLEIAGGDGRLPARLYVGSGAPTPSPLLVYFHGGGWTLGSIESHDNVCRFLATEARIRVLSIGYRLAPESRFPAAADDATASFRDAAARAAGLGADPERVAVGGDSAGGNLAAVCCLDARGRQGPEPCFQLLIYPAVQFGDRERPSYTLFGEGFFLTTAEMDWFDANYLGPDPESAARDPRAAPLRAEDLSGLPPALVVVAGYDPLRDEGIEYAGALAGGRRRGGATARAGATARICERRRAGSRGAGRDARGRGRASAGPYGLKYAFVCLRTMPVRLPSAMFASARCRPQVGSGIAFRCGAPGWSVICRTLALSALEHAPR